MLNHLQCLKIKACYRRRDVFVFTPVPVYHNSRNNKTCSAHSQMLVFLTNHGVTKLFYGEKKQALCFLLSNINTIVDNFVLFILRLKTLKKIIIENSFVIILWNAWTYWENFLIVSKCETQIPLGPYFSSIFFFYLVFCKKTN